MPGALVIMSFTPQLATCQLKQEPQAIRPGEQWVGDFTYIKTGSG